MWLSEYKPKSFNEFCGNKEAIKKLLLWADGWNKAKGAVLLLGPTGTGKTTAAELLAKCLNFNLIETNASDARKASVLKEEFSHALTQQSLFFKGKLVLFDEIDGLSGQFDRGAPSEIIELINSSRFPIVMTAIDETSGAVKKLKKEVKVIKFEKTEVEEITKLLTRICKDKKIKAEESILKQIARMSNGDVRAAILDLQAIAAGNETIAKEDLNILIYRDIEKIMNETLRIIFKTNECKLAEEAVDTSEEDLDNILLWVRENIPREYIKAEDIANAYNCISRADVFRGRIIRQQYWRFQVYQALLMSAGVSVSKSSSYPTQLEYHFPYLLSLYKKSMFSRAKDRTNAQKLAPLIHCSSKVAKSYFPLMQKMQEMQPATFQKIWEKTGISF